jgi:RimJ/RimL family protein N-acetyltransferase
MKNRTIFRKGKRVNLRLLTEDDAPLITKWINDEEVNVNLIQFFPNYLESEIEWIKSLKDNKKNIVFGIETTKGKLIGVMGLHNINYIDRIASTGAFIGRKKLWGKGYGTEAKLILLEYAFNTLNLRRIFSSCIEFNDRSLNYQKKTGGKVEGRRKDKFFRKGRYWDEILLSVSREDWLPNWEKFQKT